MALWSVVTPTICRQCWLFFLFTFSDQSFAKSCGRKSETGDSLRVLLLPMRRMASHCANLSKVEIDHYIRHVLYSICMFQRTSRVQRYWDVQNNQHEIKQCISYVLVIGLQSTGCSRESSYILNISVEKAKKSAVFHCMKQILKKKFPAFLNFTALWSELLSLLSIPFRYSNTPKRTQAHILENSYVGLMEQVRYVKLWQFRCHVVKHEIFWPCLFSK
jgi:hypothetical protein